MLYIYKSQTENTEYKINLIKDLVQPLKFRKYTEFLDKDRGVSPPTPCHDLSLVTPQYANRLGMGSVISPGTYPSHTAIQCANEQLKSKSKEVIWVGDNPKRI